jgi:hypothetical protein
VKQSRGIRLDRIFLLKATLLAAMLVRALGLPVYAQQEVDPTWYDPWATQTKVVVQPGKSPMHNREPARNTGTVSPRPHSKKGRVKLADGQRRGVGVPGHSQK